METNGVKGGWRCGGMGWVETEGLVWEEKCMDRAKQRSERVLFLEAQECSGGTAGDGYGCGSRMQIC